MSKLKKKSRVSYRNDWEYHAYTIRRKNIEELREVEIGSKKHKVFAVIDCATAYDMGHSYDVASARYYIKIPFAGVQARIYLDEIIKAGAKVFATKYMLREGD